MSSIEDSTGPDDGPPEQLFDEYREAQDAELQEWLERSLACLSSLHEVPWTDAGPESKISSEEEGPSRDRTEGEETAA